MIYKQYQNTHLRPLGLTFEFLQQSLLDWVDSSFRHRKSLKYVNIKETMVEKGKIAYQQKKKKFTFPTIIEKALYSMLLCDIQLLQYRQMD